MHNGIVFSRNNFQGVAFHIVLERHRCVIVTPSDGWHHLLINMIPTAVARVVVVGPVGITLTVAGKDCIFGINVLRPNDTSSQIKISGHVLKGLTFFEGYLKG